jgi:tRNA pseudouridine55 synthase
MNGVLLVDKPSGMTSHDVVDRIRKATKIRRVGHTGTLDPSATGLLIICIGSATRLSDHITGLSKEYTGTLRLGLVTSSYDADGTVEEEAAVPALTQDELVNYLKPYKGTIEQIPPMVSAIKVGGQRLHKLAREGKTIERKPRTVTINDFEIESWASPEATFRVDCTSGTYVRSLCHDIGQDIGCGGILSSLRRKGIGRHRVENATPLDELSDYESVEAKLFPMGDALDIPKVVVSAQGLRMVTSGNQINPKQVVGEIPESTGWVQIKTEAGELIALGELDHRVTGAWIQPRKVFV